MDPELGRISFLEKDSEKLDRKIDYIQTLKTKNLETEINGILQEIGQD